MKLIIQIPCYNESRNLPITLDALPKKVEGFDSVEWLIVNDGSTDDTVKIAKEFGVRHIVNLKQNQGLAKGFLSGIKRCVELGADVIVNTDADNQYNAQDIPKLTKPILEGKADYVIGERPISKTAHFSPIKKFLQKLGSRVVQKASATKIPDAPSGFRAMSECALELNVYNEYTYTLETIIQAGQKNMAICSVPIRTNEDLRPSRLFSSMFSYIKKSTVTILRIFVIYRPFKFFMTIAIILFSLGFLLGLRFLYFYITDGGLGHTQSIILASVLLITGFQTGLIAFIADLLAVNRKLMEEIQKTINIKTISKKNDMMSKIYI